MNWKTEFKDFDAMPDDLPEGLIDSSWGNDACPSFLIWQDDESPMFQRVTLWIDWADSNMREVPNSPRYLISAIDEDGRVDPVKLDSSDNWAAIRETVVFLLSNAKDVVKLSRYFSALIRAEYTETELREVIERNKTPLYQSGACATHDFRDANAFMFGAFAALFFRQMDFESADEMQLHNLAWELSRQAGFGN